MENAFPPRRVLITGATGFTGVNLVRRFAQAGDDVIAVDRVAPDAAVRRFLKEHAERVSFIVADVRESGWQRAVPGHGIDLVVHAAAVTNPRGEDESARARDAVEVNVGSTVGVVHWASDAGAKRFICVSTAAIYGRYLNGSGTLDEDAGDDPANIYAITKLAGDSIALRMGSLLEMPVAIARFTSGYGPMERVTPDRAHTSVIHRWFEAAAAGTELVVDRAQLPRDYTYIDDVADAIFELGGAPRLRRKLYNVSAGVPLSYGAMIAELANLYPGLNVRYKGGAAPAGDRRTLAIDRLRDDTGWTPQSDLRAGFRKYARWLHAERPREPVLAARDLLNRR